MTNMTKPKKKKKGYLWFSPNLSFAVFNKILSAIPDSGPSARELPRVLWEMLRDRYINIYYSHKDDDICVTTKNPPKNATFITLPKDK